MAKHINAQDFKARNITTSGDSVVVGDQSVGGDLAVTGELAVTGNLNTAYAFLTEYTTVELEALTAAEYEGALVACSDGDAAGPCLAYCNGTNWLIVALGAIIND